MKQENQGLLTRVKGKSKKEEQQHARDMQAKLRSAQTKSTNHVDSLRQIEEDNRNLHNQLQKERLKEKKLEAKLAQVQARSERDVRLLESQLEAERQREQELEQQLGAVQKQLLGDIDQLRAQLDEEKEREQLLEQQLLSTGGHDVQRLQHELQEGKKREHKLKKKLDQIKHRSKKQLDDEVQHHQLVESTLKNEIKEEKKTQESLRKELEKRIKQLEAKSSMGDTILNQELLESKAQTMALQEKMHELESRLAEHEDHDTDSSLDR